MRRFYLFGVIIGVAAIAYGLFVLTQGLRAFSPSSLPISAIVIPHHDLVKPQREAFLHEVKAMGMRPKTVILVSPNHYESGQANLQTTGKVWQASQGSILPNLHVIDAMKKDGGASEETASFQNKHGIKLVLDDVRDTFPNATIVPLIIKRATSRGEIERLEHVLKQTCNACVLVASVDFSHYQPALLAKLHDDATERSLDNLDVPGLLKTEVDSPAALALMATWARDAGTRRFVLKNHTDSGELSSNPDEESTSHFFGWYQTGSQTIPPEGVTFLVGGQMEPTATNPIGSLDQLGERVLWGTDASIVSVDSPLATPAIAAFKFLHVNGLADAGKNTSVSAAITDALAKANIRILGQTSTAGGNMPTSFAGEHLILKVINADARGPQAGIISTIKNVKEDPHNRVLIVTDWAATDTDRQHELAHTWVDAGADLVIGTNPDIGMKSELYRGTPIVYGLGPLLPADTAATQNQLGLLLAGEFTDTRLSLFGLPVEFHQGKPQLSRGVSKKNALDQLYRPLRAYIQATPAGDTIILSK